jgi:hypothetical protein
MKHIGQITLALLSMFITTSLNGWALSKLWAWFIIPVFAAPALSIPYAIGLSLIVGYLTYQYDARKEEADKKEEVGLIIFRGFCIGAFKPLLCLGFGWVVTLFL